MKHHRLATLAPVLGIVLLSGAAARAQTPPLLPDWWTDDAAGTRIIDGQAAENNYAPVNLGQLKHVAAMARDHLENELSAHGGAGAVIDAMVNGFETSSPANFAPANLGQLKAVAKPFYDRLLAVGYDTRQNLIDRGYPSGWDYYFPWDPDTPVEDNYAPGNIGQLKIVFSFDLDGHDPTTVPQDGDGIPDVWKLHHFGHLDHQGSHDHLGDGVTLLQEHQLDLNPLVFDTNGNGLPDAWLVDHFAEFDSILERWVWTTDFRGPDDDPDGDGLTNYEEYQLGTDPMEETHFPLAVTATSSVETKSAALAYLSWIDGFSGYDAVPHSQRKLGDAPGGDNLLNAYKFAFGLKPMTNYPSDKRLWSDLMTDPYGTGSDDEYLVVIYHRKINAGHTPLVRVEPEAQSGLVGPWDRLACPGVISTQLDPPDEEWEQVVLVDEITVAETSGLRFMRLAFALVETQVESINGIQRWLSADFDSKSGDSVILDGNGNVEEWRYRVPHIGDGNELFVFQNDPGKRPPYVSPLNHPGGHGSLTFDGEDKILFGDQVLSNDMEEIGLVFLWWPASIQNAVLWEQSGSGGRLSLQMNADGAYGLAVDGVLSEQAHTYQADEPIVTVLAITRDSDTGVAAANLYHNGRSIPGASLNAGAVIFTGDDEVALGGAVADTGHYDGEIQEVVVYQSCLDPDEVEFLTDELEFAYNLTLDRDVDILPVWWQYLHFGALGVDPEEDVDGDGFTNLEEFLNGTDPLDYYNGESPVIEILAGDGQSVAPGDHTFYAFQVRIVHAATDEPLINAPLKFETSDLHPRLVFAPYDSATAHQHIEFRTDAAGMIRPPSSSVFFRASETPSSQHDIIITAGETSEFFEVYVTDETASTVVPPRNVNRTNNGDGTVTYTWTGSPDGMDEILIEERNLAGGWNVVLNAPVSVVNYDVNTGIASVMISNAVPGTIWFRLGYILENDIAYSAISDLPRFAVVDLDTDLTPVSVTDSGTVLLGNSVWTGYWRWNSGQLEQLEGHDGALLAGNEWPIIEPVEMNENGWIYGNAQAPMSFSRAASWHPGGTEPTELIGPDGPSSTNPFYLSNVQVANDLGDMIIWRQDQSSLGQWHHNYHETFYVSKGVWSQLTVYTNDWLYSQNPPPPGEGMIAIPHAVNNHGDFIARVNPVDAPTDYRMNLNHILNFRAADINDNRTIVGYQLSGENPSWQVESAEILVRDRFGLTVLEPVVEPVQFVNPAVRFPVRVSNPADGFDEIIFEGHYWRRMAERDSEGDPTSTPTAEFMHAFLDDLIDPVSGWSNLRASCISANGVIAGMGDYTDPVTQQTEERAFMLVRPHLKAQPGKIHWGFSPPNLKQGDHPGVYWASVAQNGEEDGENDIVKLYVGSDDIAQMMEFVVDDPQFVDIEPKNPTQAIQPLTITGKSAAGSLIRDTVIRLVWKDDPERTVLTLNVMVLPQRGPISVGVYHIEDSDSPETKFSNTPAVSKVDPDDIVDLLNDVFRQAGVTFSLDSSSDTFDVPYDTRELVWMDYTTPEMWTFEEGQDGRLNDGEDTFIYNYRDWEGDVSVFFVKNGGKVYDYFDHDSPIVRGGTPIGATEGGFVSWVAVSESHGYVEIAAAHEVGHILELATANDDDGFHDDPPYPVGVVEDLSNLDPPSPPPGHLSEPNAALMQGGSPIDGMVPWPWGRWMRPDDWRRANDVARDHF